MEEKVKITVDGKHMEIERGIRVKDVLERLGVKYEGQLLVGLKATREQLMYESTSYMFETSKGAFLVEVEEKNVKQWFEIFNNIKSLQVKWVTSRDLGLGSFEIRLKPRLEVREWKPWDVVVSAEGLEVDNTHLVIVKSRHSSTYALPKGLERLGRVSRGRSIIAKLQVGDPVLSIRPLVTPKQISKALMRLNPEDRITESMEILTKVKIKLSDKSPISAEHFMSAIDIDGFIVSEAYSTFIRSDTLRGLHVPFENRAQRTRGTITVRVSGDNKGSIYVYKEPCPSSAHHNVVGYVEAGMELIDSAKVGDKVIIETEPGRLNLLGLTQAEASRLLMRLGLNHERAWLSNDEAIIVDQEPESTFQALKEGRLKTYGLPPSKVLKIRLYYEQAPKTVWYFKALTGLLTNKVGKLKTYFTDPMIGFILFEGRRDLAGALLPENNPKEEVKPLTIGVTNMSKRFVGLVGIRLTESRKYGPTGEDFAGTNLVGEVIGGTEALRDVREGATIYVMEVKQ